MEHINAHQEACKFDSGHFETYDKINLDVLRESMSFIPFSHPELAHVSAADAMAREANKEDASSAISCTSSEHTSDFEEMDEVTDQGTGSRSLLVCPRKKKAAAAAQSSDKDEPVVITKKLLEGLYGMPLSEVASKLKICPSAIRKACRRLGIEKWPFKSRNPGPKRKSISESKEDAKQEEEGRAPPPSSHPSARQGSSLDASTVEVKPDPHPVDPQPQPVGERKSCGNREGGWNLDVSWIPHSSDFADDAEEAFWNNIQQAMNNPAQGGKVDASDRM
ncbi:hypothetical protein GUITHDRAFT_122465 [Guillardia theta CCMP2712]|uniref:RWP-RK domain-containing protein n=1 Tax=Guillardia theta (strain CCMP2712) TaxID=905079 RepID=L1I542_GUITC|nr:hypothetical protein GUITHDRAFT_122465 [Guillardia theta CCMP2712]EKX31336.1 hypothetical protein GUITHDRAFT_122465 [Guillardia theta CCMP2712]|eukprot:XP_005818316.1 hypothetical protein GUITHDRAFT_122465 [Guillardia theta CCMP2712]